MNFELNQIAVYWERLVPDGLGGYTWEDPAELACRWEEIVELYTDANGQERRSQAKVFLDQDVKVGDYLVLMDLDDVTSGSLPGNTKEALQVRRFDKIPDLAGTEFLRRVWL